MIAQGNALGVEGRAVSPNANRHARGGAPGYPMPPLRGFMTETTIDNRQERRNRAKIVEIDSIA